MKTREKNRFVEEISMEKIFNRSKAERLLERFNYTVPSEVIKEVGDCPNRAVDANTGGLEIFGQLGLLKLSEYFQRCPNISNPLE